MFDLVFAGCQHIDGGGDPGAHVDPAASRANLADLADDLLAVAGQRRANHLVRHGIDRYDGYLVKGIQQLDHTHRGLVRQLNLSQPAFLHGHASRAVDDDDDSHGGKALLILDLHLYGQRLFQRRAEVAAHAVALRAANDDQTAAQVTDVTLQRFHLARAQILGVDVDEDDAGIAAERRQRRWELRRRHLLDNQTCRLQRLAQLPGFGWVRLAVVVQLALAADQQDARRAGNLGKRRQP